MQADGWIENNDTAAITWDECAASQDSTPEGSTFKGMETERVTSAGMRTLYQNDGTQVKGIALDNVAINIDKREFTIGNTGPYGPWMGPDSREAATAT